MPVLHKPEFREYEKTANFTLSTIESQVLFTLAQSVLSVPASGDVTDDAQDHSSVMGLRSSSAASLW
ncbi:MAG TPA: hypothetical protein VG206_01700 [Terriglobia bacterium]|nr:hypothetical protein [Terriglobia bacterium]